MITFHQVYFLPENYLTIPQSAAPTAPFTQGSLFSLKNYSFINMILLCGAIPQKQLFLHIFTFSNYKYLVRRPFSSGGSHFFEKFLKKVNFHKELLSRIIIVNKETSLCYIHNEVFLYYYDHKRRDYSSMQEKSAGILILRRVFLTQFDVERSLFEIAALNVMSSK